MQYTSQNFSVSELETVSQASQTHFVRIKPLNCGPSNVCAGYFEDLSIMAKQYVKYYYTRKFVFYQCTKTCHYVFFLNYAHVLDTTKTISVDYHIMFNIIAFCPS